jgi:hypothetical protein
MNRLKEKKYYWVCGGAIAFSGVAVIRLLVPGLLGFWQQSIQAVGYLLVITGLAIIASATRRKGDEEFIEPSEQTKR